MARGRPSKPFEVITAENKSHFTKSELEVRRKAEEALVTGTAMKAWQETKKLPRAIKEFIRIKKLFEKIGKNDALTEAVLNRYCVIHAECLDLIKKRETFYTAIAEIEKARDNEVIDWLEYFKLRASYQGQYIACDKAVMQKRKMLLDIEKENLMTIASVLRSIPKKPQEEEREDPMAALLKRRGGTGV